MRVVKEIIAALFLLCSSATSSTVFEWSLDSSHWRFANRNTSVFGTGRVPGGVFADLRSNGVLNEDPLRRYNDVAYRWVSEDDWIYSATFIVNSSSEAFKKKYIIFDGIDTFSKIYLNKKLIGSTNNMFVRYTFSVEDFLKEGENVLEVIIKSPIRMANHFFNDYSNKIPPFCVPKEYNGECHVNYLRKMQSSFGWDWGPAFPSVGIWKSVKLIMFQEHLLEDIKTETIAANASHWLLKTDVYVKCFESISNAKFKLALNTEKSILSIEQDCCNDICVENEIHTAIELYVPTTDVSTWWPNGYGEQPLYNLSIEFKTKNDDVESRTISIGFRTAELIQKQIDKNDPSLGLSFYFKINGVAIFAKGTNYIPANVFPEKMNDENVISNLLIAAKQVHMNTIRVWGGGVYESDVFYKLCDKLGIMVWQDMMFACNMYPANHQFLETVEVEIKQQIRRLQHHPSIILWAGNNENEAALRGNWYGTRNNYSMFASDYIALYVNTIRKIVTEEDRTRNFVVSSPTNGLKSEEENYIAENPYSALYGDVHYYNYEVNSWSSIFFPWTRFASEYGLQSLPAYQTLQKAFDVNDLINFPSPALIHRQHLPLGYGFMLYQIEINLPVPPKPTVSDYVYLSQIVQARAMRIQTEWYRKHRNTLLKDGRGLTMGALYWQLNDVWQAPTWSSIDYDQRWKMLHYSALDFFSPIIIVPELEISNNLTMYVVSDSLVDLEVIFNVEVYSWKSNTPLSTYISDTILLKNNSAQLILNENYFNWLKAITQKCGQSKDQQIRSCFLHTKLYYNNINMTEASPSNYLFPTTFNKIIGYETPNISVSRVWQETKNQIHVKLESTGIGLFVWLNVTQIDGNFNENGFVMLNKTKTVKYTSNKDISLKQFNLEIEHLRTKFI
ncbi:beta-mannosidase [Metopolophium dirhodum]|uniref:beta-mannosidase n=1 Tax=Metopolophium dirhodum TaxID=44670 RepID=UPI00298F8277|nr:beta-mannosidase [Metopolophium dirhodum]